MPKIGPEQRAARRYQFIGAARRLAAGSGYRGLTVDDVCAEAGLSKGAFYIHFASKQDLLVSMLEQEIATVQELLDDLDAAGLSEVERILGFLRAMVLRAQDPAEVQLRAELWSQVAGDPDLRARIADAVRIQRVRLADVATQGADGKRLVEMPANAFGAILVALVDGLMLHHAVDSAGFRWENVGKVVDILLNQLTLDQD